MKTILIYDCETTGLIAWDKPSDDPRQLHITQMAAELCDEETEDTISSFNLIIKPDGGVIPHELETLTGITNEKAARFGVDIIATLDMFFDMWSICDQRVAHNEPFDMRMVRIEMMRERFAQFSDGLKRMPGRFAQFSDDWKEAKSFCTQSNSTKIVNSIRPVGQKKTASLAEAYKYFTGKELKGAHNAAVDVAACKEVYFGIKKHNQQKTAA